MANKVTEEMKEAIWFGLCHLSAREMRELLFTIATTEILTMADGEDGIGNAIKYVAFVKTSIIKKIQERIA